MKKKKHKLLEELETLSKDYMNTKGYDPNVFTKDLNNFEKKLEKLNEIIITKPPFTLPGQKYDSWINEKIIGYYSKSKLSGPPSWVSTCMADTLEPPSTFVEPAMTISTVDTSPIGHKIHFTDMHIMALELVNFVYIVETEGYGKTLFTVKPIDGPKGDPWFLIVVKTRTSGEYLIIARNNEYYQLRFSSRRNGYIMKTPFVLTTHHKELIDKLIASYDA